MSFMSDFFRKLFGRFKSKAKLAKAAKRPTRKGAIYLNYSATPDVSQFPLFEVIVADPQAKFTPPPGSGDIYVYYALSEVGTTVPYFNDPSIPVLGVNENWGSKLVDIRDPWWTKFLIEQLRASYATGNFKGVFFDTADGYWALDPIVPGHLDEFILATADIINAVKSAFPDKGIIPNRCFNAFPFCKEALSGFLFEGLYYGFSGGKSAEGTAELLDLAAPIKATGLPIYVVDYLKEGQEALAREVANRIRSHGFLPFITTVELADGKILAT